MPTNLLDISYWQGALDFSKIKAAGYNYLIIRAGYGTTKDERFDEYATNCKRYGIKFGVYWFCYATNISEVKNEAKKCAEVISPYTIDLPVFYDFEYDTVTKAQNKGITLGKNECSQFTITFCDEMKRYGYTPGYYANTDYYQNYYTDAVKNKGYVFWLAHYKNDYSYHEPPYQCDFFQWTSRGAVPGISGVNFDVDVCFSEKYLNCRNLNNSSTQGGDVNMSKEKIVQQVIDDAVSFAIGIANDNSHGYSQAVRSLYNITNPTSFDCSSLVCTAYYYAFVKNGISPTPKDMGCSYTGNMMNLTKCGFEVVAKNQTAHAQMKKGDIELNTTYHTALAIDGDNIVHARSSEGTSDTRDGSGNEIRTQPWYLYSHGWTCRLRFTGNGLNLNGVKPKKFTRTNSGTVKVNTSLNVRSTPGGTVIGQVYNGNRFDVDENQTVGDWFYVKFATIGTGYISAEYVTLDKKTSTSKPDNDSNNTSTNKPTTTTKTITYKIKAKDTITSIAKEYGMTVNNLAKLNGFTPGKTIKVKQTVTTGGTATNTYTRWTGVVTASELNVRVKPGVNEAQLSTYPILKKGNQVDVIGESTGSDGDLWYHIRIAGKYLGYVHSDYLARE